MSTAAPPNSGPNIRPGAVPSDAGPSTTHGSSKWARAELTVRGVRLSCIERETVRRQSRTPIPGAPSILMLHGLVAGGDCFRMLANELPANLRVVSLDLPGGGYSDRLPTADITFEAIAQLVAGAIRALGMDRPILLGHSYGGAIALQLAATCPDLLAAMILIAPAHPFSGRENLLIRFYLSWPGRLFAHLLPHLPRRVLLEGFRRMPGTPADATYEQIETYLQSLHYPGTVAHILRLLKTWKQDMRTLAEALERRPITVPTLLLWGDRDPIVPAATAAALTRHLTTARQAIIPGAGHLPNLERPDACATLIRAFLISREQNHSEKVAAPFLVQPTET